MRKLGLGFYTFLLVSVAQGQEVQLADTATRALSADQEAFRRALKEELKAELKAELAGETQMSAPVEQDSWTEEEWKWEEPVKPELNFLNIDGYFRFRYDMFHQLDLQTYDRGDFDPATNTGRRPSGPYADGYAPPVPLCNTSAACTQGAGEDYTLGGANMRLRLEPVLNVYEDIQIKMQFDVFDNLVLGSTADGYPFNPYTPVVALSDTQLSPSDGINDLRDSIRAKRVWAEVMTPLGQLRFGRMPFRFGMGIFANDGNGIDQNYGDTVDRIMFASKISDFYVIPAFDWGASGPTSMTSYEDYGQPFDRDQRDDVDQYSLTLLKFDDDQKIREKLENDEVVLNYGTYQSGRFQALDSAGYYASQSPDQSATTELILNRDYQAYVYSYWFRFMWRKLSVEAEYSGVIGSMGNSAIAAGYTAPEKAVKLRQHGAALKLEYKLLNDALLLRLWMMLASGDTARGWGLRPLSQRGANSAQWDGHQALNDNTISNYRFDPDFIVDLILWRQLIGSITDAVIFRPGAQYNFTEGFGASLDLVYSRAWFADSTPSASFDDVVSTREKTANLGLETDVKVFYDVADGFHAWLEYGLLIPFGGLSRHVANTTMDPKDAKVAQTIQLLLAVSF